ncbi:MAG: hypothetical protein WA971_02260 [Microbacterium sp.]
MILRALRAQGRSFSGDLTLLAVALLAVALSLSLAANVPHELATASDEEKGIYAASFEVVIAIYAAIMSAIHGAFRYTVDRRNGVVARQATLHPRWVIAAARAPFTALGGSVIATLAVVGGHVALRVAIGGIAIDGRAVAAAVGVGAISALWGFAIGLIMELHLLTLFVAPLTLGVAMIVAIFWPRVAVWLPLLTMVEAGGFDLMALGVSPADALDPVIASWALAGWMAMSSGVGAVCFLVRDIA